MKKHKIQYLPDGKLYKLSLDYEGFDWSLIESVKGVESVGYKGRYHCLFTIGILFESQKITEEIVALLNQTK